MLCDRRQALKTQRPVGEQVSQCGSGSFLLFLVNIFVMQNDFCSLIAVHTLVKSCGCNENTLLTFS